MRSKDTPPPSLPFAKSSTSSIRPAMRFCAVADVAANVAQRERFVSKSRILLIVRWPHGLIRAIPVIGAEP
jgi:hypothetical protein